MNTAKPYAEYDEVMQEIWQIKDEMAEKYKTIPELFAYLQTIPQTNRMIPAPVLASMPWMSQPAVQPV
jgi:hypothetical protein